MKVGVISDIHDNIDNLKKAVRVLNKQKVNFVCFLGDLTLPATINYFKKLKVPVKAVFGNLDWQPSEILKQIKKHKLNIKYSESKTSLWEFKLNNNKVVLFHGDNEGIAEKLANSGKYDFIFSGHTHTALIKKIGKTLWLNPGSIAGYIGLDKQPVKPSLAIVNLKTKEANIICL